MKKPLVRFGLLLAILLSSLALGNWEPRALACGANGDKCVWYWDCCSQTCSKGNCKATL